MDYKKVTINAYNANAEKLAAKFDENTDLSKRVEFVEFQELLKGKKILDLGAGSGAHGVYFTKQGYDVTALDLSEEMIKICKSRGLKTVLGDIENLDLADESFDGVWAATSILHVPIDKLPKVIEKIATILKPKGILHISVKKGTGSEIITDPTQNTTRFFQFFEIDDMYKICEKDFYLVDTKEVYDNNTDFILFFFQKK